MNEHATTASEPGRTFAQLVLGIAGTVKDRRVGGPMSRGDRAELRRMRRADAFPPEPFWRLVEKYEIAESHEGFWKEIIPLMIDHPHNRELSPGRALARAGVSAARIERWLRRDRESAIAEAGRLVSRAGEGLHWINFARLLWYWNERERMRFARDFFLSPEHRDRQRKLERSEEA